MTSGARRVFLRGEWRYLAMLNYRVDPALLLPFVPRGTTLDTWQGTTYVSMVGFLFQRTRVLGLPIPLHRNFEEVNLRFYVRREVDGQVRRAVTFISELVPRRAIAALARLAYNEPYRALPMRHFIGHGSHHVRHHATNPDSAPGRVEFAWRQPLSGWTSMAVETSGTAGPIALGSEAEFITEHYWGYTRQRDGGTVEYQVTHPRWRTWTVDRAMLQGDFGELYGPRFAAVLADTPSSAFLAEGSPIAVHMPYRLPDDA